jgi:hypothetical protein
MKRILTGNILLFMLFGALTVAETNSGAPVFVVLQQDLRPSINNLNFDRGFSLFLDQFTSKRQVEVFGYCKNKVFPVASGSAGIMNWPPSGFDFVAGSARTVPFKGVLAILKHRKISNQDVYLISNFRSLGMFHWLVPDREALQEEGKNIWKVGKDYSFYYDGRRFNPGDYPPLNELAQYCRRNRVRILGFYVNDQPLRRQMNGFMLSGSSGVMTFAESQEEVERETNRFLEGLGQTSMNWLVRQTGGRMFEGFRSFEGILRSY